MREVIKPKELPPRPPTRSVKETFFGSKLMNKEEIESYPKKLQEWRERNNIIQVKK